MQITEPGRFISGGFRRHGFMNDHQALPDPTMVTRHSVWQDSLGRYWRASGRLPFGFAPYLWVPSQPVPATEITRHNRSARANAIVGLIAVAIMLGAAIAAFAACLMGRVPFWVVAALLLAALVSAHIVAFTAGRASRRRERMVALPAPTNGAS